MFGVGPRASVLVLQLILICYFFHGVNQCCLGDQVPEPICQGASPGLTVYWLCDLRGQVVPL